MKLPVVCTIALRNVREHTSKTVIIGVLITLGVAALVIGNSVMDTAAAGIRDAYIRTFTGDLVVAGPADGNASLFGQVGGGTGGPGIPPTIDEYRAVRDFLAEHERVAGVSPQVHGSAVISVEEEQAGFAFVFGIRPEEYQEAFPANLTIEEGRFLEAGEEGIVLNAGARDDLEEAAGTEIEVGDSLLLTGMSRTAGTRIRAVTVVGVFHFNASNPQLSNISLVDAQTIRALNAMNVSPVQAVELSETERRLLQGADEDELFGGEGALFGEALVQGESPGDTDGAAREEELLNIFEGAPERPQESDDITAWHFLVVRATGPEAVAGLQADLQAFLREEGIDATVMDWRQAAGPSAAFVEGIQIALNAAIILVAVVAVIIIMNTLVISVTERIPEIGTMRAIGAHKSFVRRMVLWETAILSVAFGLLGVLIGTGVLGLLSAAGLEANNQFLRFIFGGNVFRPVLSIRAVATALIGVAVAGLVASLYPTRIALQIRPVVAMQGK
jgi:putative ABC transport system permease protein